MTSQYNDKEIGISGGQVYENDSAPGSYFTTADSLVGDKVVNTRGDDLGEIEAILLDVPNGRIAYAVIAFGGFLGMGEKRFAIPWGALIMDADNEKIVLDVDKSALMEALDLNKDPRPATAGRRRVTRMHG